MKEKSTTRQRWATDREEKMIKKLLLVYKFCHLLPYIF